MVNKILLKKQEVKEIQGGDVGETPTFPEIQFMKIMAWYLLSSPVKKENYLITTNISSLLFHGYSFTIYIH